VAFLGSARRGVILFPCYSNCYTFKDSASDWENARNSASRIPQTKTIRFPAGIALGYFLCPPLCASNHLSFARQNRGFPIDRNASSKPINPKHVLLPSRVAAFGLNIGLRPYSPFSRPILHLCLTASRLHSRRSGISLQRLPVLAKGRKEGSAYPAYDRAIIRAIRIDDGGGLAIGAGQVVCHGVHLHDVL
jgi:hypothetical protein